MAKKIEDVRKLAERLGMLKERRRQLDAEISELELDLDNRSGKGVTGETAVPALVAEQILEVMGRSAEATFDTAELERQLQGVRSATIRAALSRLVKESKVRRVKRGVYKLAPF
jgi:hypothetical protein